MTTELNTKEELLVDDILKDFSYKAIYTAGKRAQNENRSEINESDVILALKQHALPNSGFWESRIGWQNVDHEPRSEIDIIAEWNSWNPNSDDVVGTLVKKKISEF